MLQRFSAAARGSSIYSARYKRLVALLLMAAYTYNSMDRTIVSIVASSIKSDLKLTDTQLGLLGGTAFAVRRVTASALRGIYRSGACAPSAG